MLKSLFILVIFISVSQIFAQSPEIKKESIDESFEHKIDQPEFKESQERSLAGEEEQKQVIKKGEETPKVKYWQYQHEAVGPKY